MTKLSQIYRDVFHVKTQGSDGSRLGFEVKPGGVGVQVPLGAAFTPGARVRYPLGTVVNTAFFQIPMPTFGRYNLY